MSPLSELAARLRKTFPEAQLDFDEPATPKGVGFLDINYDGKVVVVQWQEKWQFGISTPEGHGYGEHPDEVYRTVDSAEARITYLLNSGLKTGAIPV